mgnify:CR=1 FL=1
MAKFCTKVLTLLKKRRKSEIQNSNGKYSFRLFVVNFVGNVNPRSYQGLLNLVDPNWSAIERQTAVLETVIERMVKRTMFEIEGWKRILAIRQIFNQLNLNIDNYKLTMEKIEANKFEVRITFQSRNKNRFSKNKMCIKNNVVLK